MDESPLPAETPPSPASDTLVDDWFARHFHNLGVRVETALYNEFYAAKEELKQQLRTAAGQ